MDKDIVVHKSEWEESKEKIQYLLKSGFLPSHIKTAQQAFAISEMGKAIGLAPIVALNTIYVIGGKPTVNPAMMLALAKSKGLVEDQKIERFADKVSFTVLRKGNKTPHVEVFGKEDAMRLGLAGKDNYKKQPMVMYAWRAISAAMRLVFPDVIYGLYTPEEMGATIEISAENELEGSVVQENRESLTERILARLAAHAGGDEASISDLLKSLTLHGNTPNEKWLKITDLYEVGVNWLEALLKKMDDQKIGVES